MSDLVQLQVPCPREDANGYRIPCPYNAWTIDYEWRDGAQRYAVVQNCTLCGRKLVESYVDEIPA